MEQKYIDELNRAIIIYKQYQIEYLREDLKLREIELCTKLYIYLLEQYKRIINSIEYDDNDIATYRGIKVVHNEKVSEYEGFRFVFSVSSINLKNYLQELKEEGKNE